MFEILLLDLDDTILDFAATERKGMIRLLEYIGVQPTEEVLHRYHVINLRHWEMLEKGQLTREQLGPSRFAVLFSELGITADPLQCQALYRQYLSEGDDVLPGAREALERLRGRYRLFAATNSSVYVQNGRLARTGLRPCFENVFVSEELGADKPSEAFFCRCFAQIEGFRKEKAMMVGDSLTSDILGGNNAGIATCWINPKHRPRREGIRVDHEIETLSQLPVLLETL